MRKKTIITDQQWIDAIETNLSFAEALRSLGLFAGGANYETLKRKIKAFNIDISHMTGQGWNTGKRFRRFKPTRSIKEILVKDSNYVNSRNVKNRLISEGLKEHKCECCGRTEWNGKPIPLELHHINGVRNDLRIENLAVICPNCHAQTDNYRGKNMKK